MGFVGVFLHWWNTNTKVLPNTMRMTMKLLICRHSDLVSWGAGKDNLQEVGKHGQNSQNGLSLSKVVIYCLYRSSNCPTWLASINTETSWQVFRKSF